MQRNLEAEFDSLRSEVTKLREIMTSMNAYSELNPMPHENEPTEISNDNGDGKQWKPKTLTKLMKDVTKFCKHNNHIGTIATVGYFDATVTAGFKKIENPLFGSWSTKGDESTIADLANELGVELIFTSYLRYCIK